jgi:hypothetical protein
MIFIDGYVISFGERKNDKKILTLLEIFRSNTAGILLVRKFPNCGALPLKRHCWSSGAGRGVTGVVYLRDTFILNEIYSQDKI